MWYENPGLLALFISIFSLWMSIMAYRHRKITAKSEVQRTLGMHAHYINDVFISTGIKSPYAHLLKKSMDLDSKEKITDFNAKASVLLKHIIMLRQVYENKKILGNVTLKTYEKWAKTIFRPWIEDDEELKQIYKLAFEKEDIIDKELKKWLRDSLPII